MTAPSALRVGIVYPELLGTYGDRGNGVVLARRAAWRGYPVELVEVGVDEALPTLDIYCLGGGEDGPQVRAAAALRAGDALRRAVEGGAVVLAVCAGYQLVGTAFPDADGRPVEGVGLLDVATVKGGSGRMVGEVVSEPVVLRDGLVGAPAVTLPRMTGFENHAGVTCLGHRARPLGQVISGAGNGTSDRTEGAWAERVVGTYLHGPVLARNPALADLLLCWALGVPALEPLDDQAEEALRSERLARAQRDLAPPGYRSTLRRAVTAVRRGGGAR